MASESEEMGSLFEGMILFNPSASGADAEKSMLDENLFSDLTLMTQLQDEEDDDEVTLPPSDLPPAAVSRQNSTSRRRKKAAALRIGYGRDRDFSIEIPEQESSVPSSITAAEEQDNDDTDAAVLNHVKENPVELKFEQIRASITDKLKLAREAVFSVSALRKESICRRRKAVNDLNAASSLHRVLEKKLDEACDTEDFETAETVSENLASAEKEKDRLVILLRDAETYCDVVDTKMHEALESLIQAEEECVYLLRRFSEEAASNADTVLMNAEAASSKDNAEWISSVEAIEVSKFELEIQCQLVQESKSVLNELIDHSMEDDRMEVDVLCKRKDVLTEELRILLSLVKEKEAEIAENDALIQKVGNRIHEAVSCFKEVQASVDNNYDKLQSRLSELMVENEVLQRRKKEIDNYLSQEESKGEKIRNLSIISADEASMYEEAVGLRKSLASLISQSMAYRVSLAKREQMVSEEVQILKQETFAATSSLQELSSTKSNIQQEVESCKQRLLFIDRRIPELEAEKKVAATTRNFKEAARLAAEAKALCIEKEEIQGKLDSTESELKNLEEEICRTVDRLQETEAQISSKEKELAMARFQRLILVARAARAERSAALKLGDREEAEALMLEVDAAEVEARKLQPIYNFKEEEIENLPKIFISSELVTMLDGKQLQELAASANSVTS